jgi:two-component system NarL family sensor kinase
VECVVTVETAATLEERYRAVLHRYLARGEELALLDAYELGRNALNDGLGVLQMAAIHTRAIATTLTGPAAHTPEVQLAAETFFVEALSPFEMAHRAYRDSNTMLRRLNDVLEGQAKRIAYALHNEAGQLLASVHFALAAGNMDAVRELLVEMETRLRSLSHELRPPVLDDLGLAAALDLLADTVSKRWGVPVAVQVKTETRLPASIENTLYRIVQEALINVGKHADATSAKVFLRQRDQMIACSIRDDGVGFDMSDTHRPGLGLTEIRERVAALGGAVRLQRNGDRETELRIVIPLEA